MCWEEMQDGNIDLFRAQNLSAMAEKLIILMKGQFRSLEDR